MKITNPMTVRQVETLVRRAIRNPDAACRAILAWAENEREEAGAPCELLWNDTADMLAVVAPGGRLAPDKRGPDAYWKLETAVRDCLIERLMEAGYQND